MAEIPDYLKQPWPTSRQFERRPLETRLVLALAGRSRYRGWCENVGEGGLGATVAAPLNLADEVSLEFRLTGSPEPLSIRAVVRFTDGFRHGFEFLDLTPAQRAVILSYLGATEAKRPFGQR
jgi:hypothetical protein